MSLDQHTLLAAEWKRARDGRMTAARLVSGHVRRVLVRVARTSNHRHVMYLRGAKAA